MKIDYDHREFWLKEFPERAAEMDQYIDGQVKKFDDLDAQEMLELASNISPGKAREIAQDLGAKDYMPSELDQKFGDDLDSLYRDMTGQEMVVIGSSEFWPSHVLEKLDKHEYDRQLGDWIDEQEPALHRVSGNVRDPENGLAFYVEGLDDIDPQALREEILTAIPQLRAAVEQQSLEANTPQVASWSPYPRASAPAAACDDCDLDVQEQTYRRAQRL